MFTAMRIGEFFNVAINISLVQDLRSLEFTLAYNSNILDAVQIIQGSFFPPPPRSHFGFEENSILGSVKVDLSLATSEPPKNGSGTLATIRFKLIEEPDSCLCSAFALKQTMLLDSQSIPIAHDRTGSVVFWRSMGPDPPAAGALDEFTQKGGEGRGATGGTFVLHEMVYLISSILYANDPLVNKLVAFQVVNPLNETVFVQVVFSDENGCAIIMFRIPGIGSSLGTWSAFSVVEVDEKVVWDTLTFAVTLGPTAVGGRSSAYTMEGGWADRLCTYFAFTVTLTAFSALILRINRKQRNLPKQTKAGLASL
jgi:hypothetical protein